MKTYLALLLTALVVACGGGGSSGGAGGGNNPWAGSYVGTATLTVRAAGVAPQTDTVALTIEIDGSGAVRVMDAEGTAGMGQLNGNTFSFTNPVVGSASGIDCTGTQTFTGTITDSSISGRITGDFACSGPGGSLAISMEGSFSVSLVRAASPVVPYGDFEHGLMDAVRRLLQP